MTGLQLRMDVETVEGLATQVETERNTTVNDLLGRLRNINSELDTAWDGTAQQAFTTRFPDWINQLDQFTNTLENVATYLRSVASNYRELDAAARQAVESATAR
jgi:WXG100 family type VII secretion target